MTSIRLSSVLQACVNVRLAPLCGRRLALGRCISLPLNAPYGLFSPQLKHTAVEINRRRLSVFRKFNRHGHVAHKIVASA